MPHMSEAPLRLLKKPELKSLQILRAIAAISVIYYHIDANPYFGSFGVDIFFVISGFVIAMVLTKKQNAYEFFVNRVSRIVPLYWTLTTCLLLIAFLAPQLLNSTTANLENYAKSLLFIPYFKESGTLRPLLAVGWTLNYEMFFYFCIWIAIVFAQRYYLQCTAFLVMSAYVIFGFYSEDRILSVFFRNPQLLEFLLGIFAFKLYEFRQQPVLPKPVAMAIAVSSYLFMAVAETNSLRLNGLLVYGIPSFILVLSMLDLEEMFASKPDCLAIRLWSSMGDASYATYLSHFYVVEAVRKIGFKKLQLIDPYTPAGVFIILLLSLLLGQMLYIFLDKPLSRYFKNRMLAPKLAEQPA